jgi:hypothetical protein
MTDKNGMPGWPTIIALIGFGALGLVTEVFYVVRHVKRSWRVR